jgi:hypothetical protein
MGKFGSYNELSTGADDDLLLILDDSATETKYITLANILAYILSKTLASPYINEAVAATVTSTELNQLHSQGAVAADFAKLHAITVSAANINTAVAEALAIVAGTQALAGLDVNGNGDISGTLNIGSGTTRKVTPGGTSVNNANGNPNISDTLFSIHGISASSWASIGPTGSGAGNIWTALDSVPADAAWIEIVIYGTCTDGAASSYLYSNIYARKNGGAQAAGTGQACFSSGDYSDGSGKAYDRKTTQRRIAVNSGVFDMYWNSTFTGNVFNMVLVDWGFNA